MRLKGITALLAAIVDSSDDAIVSKTLDGIITSWNRGAEQIFGYTAAEAIGQHITLIIPPERFAEEDDVIAHIRRGEKVDHYETVRQAKDGRRVDISLTVSPVVDGKGRIIGASKVARDITARKRAEADRSLLAAIVNSSHDAILSTTVDGIIASWNLGAENIFGYSPAETIGQRIALLVPPELYAEQEDVLARIGQGEKLDSYETAWQADDGRKVAISLTVSAIADAKDAIIGISMVARDITARKRAEEERERLVASEESARRTAEQASRAKDNFFATVSHELRNPLNAIVGWAGLLRSGKLDPEKRARAVEAILRSAQAQDQIIDDLLDISRIITGRLRLNVRPLQLSEVLESAIDTIGPGAEAKQIRLHVLLDPAASPMAGDADRLRQVFWNLLSNGVKFTPNEGRIEVVSQRINSHIEIMVKDNGIGIEPDLLPYVFDRFRQGDSRVNRTSQGLGLGLAIVRNLVELHGGTVLAESDGIGRGASFTVRLPTVFAISAADEVREVPPPVDRIAIAENGPSLQNLKILVVDDEARSREVLSAILIQADAEVMAVESAIEALEVLDEWRPDVLVADIGMPNVDGYELIRRVRARSPRSGGTVPAAALTAYARTQDRMRVLSEGYQMHVPKPIQPAEIVTVVASLANRLR